MLKSIEGNSRPKSLSKQVANMTLMPLINSNMEIKIYMQYRCSVAIVIASVCMCV